MRRMTTMKRKMISPVMLLPIRLTVLANSTSTMMSMMRATRWMTEAMTEATMWISISLVSLFLTAVKIVSTVVVEISKWSRRRRRQQQQQQQ